MIPIKQVFYSSEHRNVGSGYTLTLADAQRTTHVRKEGPGYFKTTIKVVWEDGEFVEFRYDAGENFSLTQKMDSIKKNNTMSFDPKSIVCWKYRNEEEWADHVALWNKFLEDREWTDGT